MIKTILVLLKYYCFWLLFFLIDRLVFILYFSDKLQGVSFVEIIKSFLYGLWMDLSMAGYISVLPLLLFILSWLIPRFRIPGKILKGYTKILIVIFALISVINFNI